MKDIIAAQHVQRRAKPSLLSNAQKYRGIADNPAVADQQLPKRKKKSLLELIREKSGAGKVAGGCPELLLKQEVSRVSPKSRTPRKQDASSRKTSRNCVSDRVSQGTVARAPRASQKRASAKNGAGWNNQGAFDFAGMLRAAGSWCARANKKVMMGFCVGLSVFFCAFSFDYIPDPEPPEDRVIREHPVFPLAPLAGDEIPLDLTEVFAWQSYTVEPGDAVETIAKHYGLSMDAVIASNDLRNVRRLQAGQAIRIPNMDGIPYTVKNGDSYTAIAASFEVPLEAVLDANDIQSDDINAGEVLFIPGARMDRTALREALGELFVWPISGRRTSAFGWRNDPFTGVRSYHAAMDISAPTGTAVRVTSDGRVSSVGYNAVYGNFVIVTHSREYQSMYAHLNRILVKTGSYVDQGTIIARSGNTGRSTGPHLHFAVYKNKRAINPLEVLNR